MEQINFTETEKPGNKDEKRPKNEHAEAIRLVEKHKDYFEHYAKGGIKVEPAPEGLNTFAFDLKKNIIYVNSLFYDKFGFSNEKTVFAILHEIEHFLEKIQILSEDGGERAFEKLLKKIKSSRAFSLMDNCIADIRENRAVVSKTNEAMNELERKIYKENMIPETDFTKDPRHIQFCNALLREARVPEEKCEIAPDVRQALDEVAKVPDLMDVMTNPQTPMSLRLKLQDKFIWPKVQELLEKDKEDKKKEKEEEQSGEKNDSGQGEGDKKEGEEPEGGEDRGKGEADPNKMFADDYDKAGKKFPEAVPLEEIEKAFKEWKEEKEKNSPDKADEEYAKKIGVEKEDLQNYRKIVEEIEKIINPETNVAVLEELKNLFTRIISKRMKPLQAPKYPVEEGDDLVDPAQLVADVKSGNLQPKVWEDTEIKEKKGDRFGEVEITLVCDRSSSMKDGDGQKAVEQRKSAVLLMEALKAFADMCEEERLNVDKPLEVKSEIFSFASDKAGDKIPLKEMSKDLGEAERIAVLKKLYNLPGSTTDFNCLEAIEEKLEKEEDVKKKIKEGELKKIVMVLTDGGSDKADRVQIVLEKLRKLGVVVIGIGVTKSGQPTEVTYAPDALVAEDVSRLPIVIGELLKEHLKDI